VPIPRLFWVSASVAILLVASSIAYFFLAVMPAVQRHRDEQAAEIAKRQADKKQIADCADQARRAVEDFGKYSSVGIGLPSSIISVTNHYNHELGKCLVDVETLDKNGTVEYLMDAYELSTVLWCSNRAAPKVQRVCMDSKHNTVEPADADKQMDALLRQ
jgi:hypothetical protein